PPARLARDVLLEWHQEDRGDDEERRPDGGDGREADVAEEAGPDRLEHVGEDRPDEATGQHGGRARGAQAARGGDRSGFGHRAPVPVRTIQTLFQRIWRSSAGDMCWM